jgi:hypothetical protein
LFFNCFKKLKSVYIFKDFLQESDCKKIITFLNSNEFKQAHQFNSGRHNNELFTSDKKIIELIESKINKLKFDGRKILNHVVPFEFYKYEKFDFITAHVDSPIYFDTKLRSNYTAIIYLNDDFVGGDTFFVDLKYKINPVRGTLLLFEHHLLHEALRIELGTKYIYRSNWFVS